MPGPIPRPRPPRLASINPVPGEKPKSLYIPRPNKPLRKQPPPVVSAPAEACCSTPELSDPEDDGPRLCYSCGKVLSSESTITAEVTFGETAAGAAVVQGGFVGENQRHANTMGGTMRGMGGSTSREQTEWRGKSEIQKLCGVLNIRLNIEEQAFSLYKLALGHNFVQGRRVRNVAAICIYLASRRHAQNTLMLMDLAEKIQVNIWVLGDNYKKFLSTIMMDDPEMLQGHKTVQQIEPLMLKFCRKLEFGEDAHRVAEDACKILRRMSRDWMVQGRQPAGLCGACIILAARMNNFRRTVREVVYVVKVADSTINSRLHEFRQLKTAKMTVEDFRKLGHLVKVEIMPPSIYKRAEKEERKRKLLEGRDDEQDETEDAEEGEDVSASAHARKKRKTTNSSAVPVNETSPNSPRRDEDGFVIPDLPGGVDGEDIEWDEEAALDKLSTLENPEDNEEYQPIVKRRGRPKKNKDPPYRPPPEDLEVEADLEEEVEGSIQAWDSIFQSFTGNSDHPILVAAGRHAKSLALTHRPSAHISEDPEVGEDEFEDDEDVMNCQLTPAEVIIKSRIWVTENEDWLRENQRKMLAAELEEATGKEKKVKTRRKHRQIGDGSLLRDQPASSTAEAVQIMLKERAKGTAFSTHVNYEALKSMYGGGSIQTPISSAASPAAASPAHSGTSLQSKPPPPPLQKPPAQEHANLGEDDAEGEEEEYEEDYEEDYENQYMENTEEYGFDDEEY